MHSEELTEKVRLSTEVESVTERVKDPPTAHCIVIMCRNVAHNRKFKNTLCIERVAREMQHP